MTAKSPPSLLQSILRTQVETAPSLLALYDRLRRIVEHLPPELRDDPKTEEIRAVLADVLPRIQGPFLTLSFRRSLCSCIDEQDEEGEFNPLCVALLQHIGGPVEMYRQAVAADPDHAALLGGAIDDESDAPRERPSLREALGDAEEGPLPMDLPLPWRRSPG